MRCPKSRCTSPSGAARAAHRAASRREAARRSPLRRSHLGRVRTSNGVACCLSPSPTSISICSSRRPKRRVSAQQCSPRGSGREPILGLTPSGPRMRTTTRSKCHRAVRGCTRTASRSTSSRRMARSSTTASFMTKPPSELSSSSRRRARVGATRAPSCAAPLITARQITARSSCNST